MDNTRQFEPKTPKKFQPSLKYIKPIHIGLLMFIVGIYGAYYMVKNYTPTGIVIDGLTQFHTPKDFPSDITFLDDRLTPHTLDEFKGHVVLLHFWATWCLPCIDEMPELEALKRNTPDKKFFVLPISIDSNLTPEEIQDFLYKLQVHSLVNYLDPSLKAYTTAQNALNSRGLPYTVIIGPDGKAVGKTEGAFLWNRDKVVEYLEYYIEAK